MKMMCLSDLHLGDGKSALNDATVVDRVVADLAKAAGGVVETLVLNGDVWEQCIPAGSLEENPGEGLRPNGFMSSVAQASRYFFSELFGAIDVGQIVWVPGNHDLSLWKKLSDAAVVVPGSADPGAAPFYTDSSGVVLSRSSSALAQKFFDVLFKNAEPRSFKVAYPVYLAGQSAPDDFPYVLFTHGHLLDTLVRGLESTAVYLGLKALGCDRPYVPDNASLRDIARTTDPFTLALWKEDSSVDYTLWNFIVRRLVHPHDCPMDGCPTSYLNPTCHPSSPRDGIMPQASWFLEAALTDDRLPTPVGSLRASAPESAAFNKLSCFVVGHDHLGTVTRTGVFGVPFQIFDSGGWTVEFDGHVPHTHALLWDGENGTTPSYLYLSPNRK
jgi:hypothetical protein